MTTTVAAAQPIEFVVGDDPTAGLSADPVADVVEQDLLVEDVSIDGMCGVY